MNNSSEGRDSAHPLPSSTAQVSPGPPDLRDEGGLLVETPYERNASDGEKRIQNVHTHQGNESGGDDDGGEDSPDNDDEDDDEKEREDREEEEERGYYISPFAQVYGSIRWTKGCVVLPGARITVHTFKESRNSVEKMKKKKKEEQEEEEDEDEDFSSCFPSVLFGPYNLIEEFAVIDIYLTPSSIPSSQLVLCGGYNRFKSYSHVVLVQGKKSGVQRGRDDDGRPSRRMENNGDEDDKNYDDAGKKEDEEEGGIGEEILGTGNLFHPHAKVDLRMQKKIIPQQKRNTDGEGSGGSGSLSSSYWWWPLKIGDLCRFGSHVHVSQPYIPSSSSSLATSLTPCHWRWWSLPPPPPPSPSLASGIDTSTTTTRPGGGYEVHRCVFLVGSPSLEEVGGGGGEREKEERESDGEEDGRHPGKALGSPSKKKSHMKEEERQRCTGEEESHKETPGALHTPSSSSLFSTSPSGKRVSRHADPHPPQSFYPSPPEKNEEGWRRGSREGVVIPTVWVLPTGGVRSVAEVEAIQRSSRITPLGVGDNNNNNSSNMTTTTTGKSRVEELVAETLAFSSSTSTVPVKERRTPFSSPEFSAIRKEEERYKVEVEQMCRIYIEMYGAAFST